MNRTHGLVTQYLLYAYWFTYSNHTCRVHEASGFIIYVSGCNMVETHRVLDVFNRRDMEV